MRTLDVPINSSHPRAKYFVEVVEQKTSTTLERVRTFAPDTKAVKRNVKHCFSERKNVNISEYQRKS